MERCTCSVLGVIGWTCGDSAAPWQRSALGEPGLMLHRHSPSHAPVSCCRESWEPREETSQKKVDRSGNKFGGGTINSRQTGKHVLSRLQLRLGCKLTGAGQTSLFHVSECCATTSLWSQLLPKHWGTLSYTHCPSFILCIFTLASNANSGSSGESCPSPGQVLIETFVHHQGIYSCCTLQEIKREHTND